MPKAEGGSWSRKNTVRKRRVIVRSRMGQGRIGWERNKRGGRGVTDEILER